jgi:hypothetical protein
MMLSFEPGDFLVFQIESGFALLRVLSVDSADEETVWHVALYDSFYMDVESADVAIESLAKLKFSIDHVALTNRAFESTQVARISNIPLEESELGALAAWRSDPDRQTSDRSVRLMMGIR